MTDIVEQAARRLYEAGAPYADSKYWAKKLADAGLLRDGKIPIYAMVDLWQALHNTSHPEFDEFYAEHRYADSWALLISAVRQLAQPTRTMPTRDEIVDVILDTHLFDGGTPIDTADAILALLAGQPTVAEVKARALEEAATEIKAQTLEEVAHVLAEQEHFTKKTQGAKELKDRAQQIRDGK